MIAIDEIYYEPSIYPRKQHSKKTIEAYTEALYSGAEFPEVILQEVSYEDGIKNVLIDGYHRWEAYKSATGQPDLFGDMDFSKIEYRYWQPEKVFDSTDKLEMLRLKLQSAKLNSHHGDRLKQAEKKDIARDIATGDPKHQITQDDITDGLDVSQKTISNWVSDIRAKQTAGRDCLIKRLSLLGWTQSEIGELVELSQHRVSQIINFSNFTKIDNEIATFLKQGQTMKWIADHYSLDLTLTWALRLHGLSDEERAEQLGITIKKYNTWNYQGAHDLIGHSDFHGRIPGQIPFNVIHWFSNQGDLVIDPMSGSGSTMDACLLLNRQFRGFDLTPQRQGIQQADTTKSIPYKKKQADLIFVDPPYFGAVDYGDGLSNGNLDEFFEGIFLLLTNCNPRLKEGGYFAFMMGNQSTKISEEQQPTLNLIDPCKEIIKGSGFKHVMDIVCPYPNQNAQHWAKAKWDAGFPGDLKREVGIYVK